MKPFDLVERQEDKYQYTSIDRVVEMVYRQYKFITDIKVSDVLEWVGEIYGNLEVPYMFRNKMTGMDAMTPHIDIVDHRGILPIDFRKVLKGGIRDHDNSTVYRESLGTFSQFRNNLHNDTITNYESNVYNIKGGYIFVEEDNCTLEMAYEAFPIDERGYPLIPDKQKVLDYAKELIAERVTFNLYAAGKISKDVWETIDKRRMWSAGGAFTQLIRPDAETMESWTWARLRLIPRISDHSESFEYFGTTEDLRLGTE